MAETFSDRAAFVQHPTHLWRVRMAIVKAAIDIAAEADDAPNHEARATLAQQVLRSPGPWADVFIHGVANSTNVGLGGADDPTTDGAGDSALQFVVNSLWDAYA